MRDGALGSVLREWRNQPAVFYSVFAKITPNKYVEDPPNVMHECDHQAGAKRSLIGAIGKWFFHTPRSAALSALDLFLNAFLGLSAAYQPKL